MPTQTDVYAAVADVPQEAREAAAAWFKYYKNPTPENLQAALKESLDVSQAAKAAGWNWQQTAFAVLFAVVSTLLMVGAGTMAVRQLSPEPVAKDKEPAVVKVEQVLPPIKVEPDLAKLLTDEFTKLCKSMDSVADEVKAVSKKLDERPPPAPKPDVEPTPEPVSKKLSLPERVDVVSGGELAVRIKATAPTAVKWFWRASEGFSADVQGPVLFASAKLPGSYLVVAYTSANGEILDAASCTVVANTAPQPPPPTPEPKPDPKPPEPKPAPKVDALTIVLVWDTSDLNEWTKSVVGDYAFFKSLEPLGVKWFKVGKQQKDADGQLLLDSHNYRKYVDAQGLPTVIYFDKTGLVLKAARLTDTASIRATVTELMGK